MLFFYINVYLTDLYMFVSGFVCVCIIKECQFPQSWCYRWLPACYMVGGIQTLVFMTKQITSSSKLPRYVFSPVCLFFFFKASLMIFEELSPPQGHVTSYMWPRPDQLHFYLFWTQRSCCVILPKYEKTTWKSLCFGAMSWVWGAEVWDTGFLCSKIADLQQQASSST